jgi:hypothetical protein
MRPQAEARVWQVLGLLVVIAGSFEIRSAAHLVATISSSGASMKRLVPFLALVLCTGVDFCGLRLLL